VPRLSPLGSRLLDERADHTDISLTRSAASLRWHVPISSMIELQDEIRDNSRAMRLHIGSARPQSPRRSAGSPGA
jgi:hypothetical protein